MADHTLNLSLFYDGVYNPAPVYQRDAVTVMRGVRRPGSDLDPASANATLDNRDGRYAPRSVVSSLRGKIGQNTGAQVTIDGAVRLTGEASQWRPGRAIAGDAWTSLGISGVLQRIGRGTDPIKSTMRRASELAGPVAYWPLEAGLGNVVANRAALAPSAAGLVKVAALDAAILPAGTEGMPTLGGAVLTAGITATSVVSWRVELMVYFDPGSLDLTSVVRPVEWITGGGITRWWIEVDAAGAIMWAQSPYMAGSPFGNTFAGSLDDGLVHHLVLDVEQTTSTNMHYLMYQDGVLVNSGNNTTGVLIGQQQVGAPTSITINPDGSTRLVSVGHVSVLSPRPATPMPYGAVGGYDGELAADRFTRLGAEEGIPTVVVGTAADTVVMGPQKPAPLLEEFDLIARTDDASIFETKTALGLTMRTGASKLNQAPDVTISYLGQVVPPVLPVVGDEGIRNDVTARSQATGAERRVQQLSGPRNVNLPAVNAQGVGRYATSIDVNASTEDGLANAAGWRVNLGTFDGTWYAELTVDLDAAPLLRTAVDALDIGDVVALSNVPADEALDTVESIIIGIEDQLRTFRRRTVTLYCAPAEPYRVGLLALTSGDTDPFLGHLDTDGSTTVGATAAGAATFSVATSSGPIWTTIADDFPLDVIVGGQRVSVSSISGAASPQTFTVQVGGRQVLYPIPAGSAVNVQLPIILTQ